MKLAEALAERSDCQKRLEEIRDRLSSLARVPCAQAAKQLGVSTTTVSIRRKQLGIPIVRRGGITDDKAKRIRDDLSQKIPRKQIAENYGVSIVTVNRQARLMPKIEPDQHLVDQMRGEKRSKWLRILAEEGESGIKVVRANHKALYAELYRTDREWMLETNLNRHVNHVVKGFVDWQERDARLCAQLKEYLDGVRKDSNRPQLTRTTILRALGNESMIRINTYKLPGLIQALDRATESRDAYERFRIDRAMELLQREGREMAVWRVEKLAGFRHLSPAGREYAERCIDAKRREMENPGILGTAAERNTDF